MGNFARYKRPLILVVIIAGALMFMMTIGFVLGILSDDPDGLERSLIDAKGEEWVEGLSSPWEPIFGWIGNDYIVAIIGISLTVLLIVGFFALIAFMAKKKRKKELEE
jgi:hypothetical protein